MVTLAKLLLALELGSNSLQLLDQPHLTALTHTLHQIGLWSQTLASLVQVVFRSL
jgi:hypothetical protein